MKKLIVVLILVASLMATPVYAQAQEISVTGVSFGPSSSPIEVEPGSYNVPLFIYVTNVGQLPAINVSVRLESTNIFYVITEPNNASLISPGNTVPFIAYVNVSSKAVSGVYKLPIMVSYAEGGVQKNFTYYAQLPISTFSSMQVYSVYWGSGATLAYPGASGLPLTVVVRNTGTNTAYNATVTLSLGYPFYSASGNKLQEFIGTVPPDASVPLEFYLNVNISAATGYYPLNVTFQWNNGITDSQQVYVPVLGAPKVTLQSFGLNPPQVFPGTEDAELILYVVNSGNVTANSVNISVSVSKQMSLISPSQTTIGLLPPGTPVQLTYLISVSSNASSPSYSEVTLNISYIGRTYSYILKVPISSKAQLSMFPEFVNLTQGASDVTITYNITNYGNTSAKDVQAELELPNMLSGNIYDYLGDIPPGQSAIAVFSLDVGSNAPTGTFRGTIVATWLQDNAPGQIFSERIPVYFTIKESYINQLLAYVTTPPGLYYIIIAILVIIVSILALLLARRR